MLELDRLFLESKNKPVIYEGKEIRRYDYFPVKDNDILIVEIESATGKHREGLTIDINGKCEIDGKIISKGKGIRVQFWADYSERTSMLKVLTKKGDVCIYNMCEYNKSYVRKDENGNNITVEIPFLDYGRSGAGMVVEEMPQGRRYRCSDIDGNTDFNDIVFTVKKIV